MPNHIVLRLTPAAAIDPGTFATYLANLTVKVYDISYVNPAGQADAANVIGSAQYLAPTPVPAAAIPPPPPPFYSYASGTSIAQHIDSSGNPLSVATAVIPVPPGTAEYVGPSI